MIARLKIASEMSLEHYNAPLLLTHSGGKDSCVLTELALRAEIPFEVLQTVMSRIINEVKGVNRVFYDLTSKPPGTIEFE